LVEGAWVEGAWVVDEWSADCADYRRFLIG